jgi:16S rRNA (cytidine1402-2'-O)-methyltransferase
MALLHLIPCPIAEDALHTIPAHLHDIIKSIKVWCVEDLKSARRYLKAIDKQIVIDDFTS